MIPPASSAFEDLLAIELGKVFHNIRRNFLQNRNITKKKIFSQTGRNLIENISAIPSII
jgi:hypothetical protein